MTFINEAAREFKMSDELPFTLCERTVSIILDGLKEQAEAMARQGDMSGRNGQAIAFVESLLPKPDRAKELADEFQSWFCHSGQTLNETSIAADTATAFARWLIQSGKLS